MSGKSGARSNDDAGPAAFELAADLEDAISSTQYRFSAGQAYYRQVERRIEELRRSAAGRVQPFRGVHHPPAGAEPQPPAKNHRQPANQLAARIQRHRRYCTRVEVSLQRGRIRRCWRRWTAAPSCNFVCKETVEGLSVGVLTYARWA